MRLENRAKILFNIAEQIKSALPDIILAVRLPAQDHIAEGLTTEEMIYVVKQLEILGVDLVDVSSGIGGWRRPDGRIGQGYLVSDAISLKAHLTIPVIGVGGIETGQYIDELVSNGDIDFAAVGRAILSDPSHWRREHL